jgi:hypothetical protein
MFNRKWGAYLEQKHINRNLSKQVKNAAPTEANTTLGLILNEKET